MFASRRQRMRAKLYQSSRAMATLTPSSNQKDFAASEWKRSTAAKLVMRASKPISSAETGRGERAIGDSVVFPCMYVKGLSAQNNFSARRKFPKIGRESCR